MIVIFYKTPAVVMPSPVRYGKHVVDPDGLEYVAAVGGEGLEPGGDRVLDVAGKALHVHWEPVRIVVGHLITN